MTLNTINTVATYGMSRTKRNRMFFASACIAEVFPGTRDNQMPKERIFDRAARYARQQDNCPNAFYNVEVTKTYMRNKWPTIRLMLAREHGFVPTYVNGTGFGVGGGYRKGDAKHVRKQIERDVKIADGVVRSVNEFAEGINDVFPQIEVQRRHLVARQIT